jgi:hypothetical protein
MAAPSPHPTSNPTPHNVSRRPDGAALAEAHSLLARGPTLGRYKSSPLHTCAQPRCLHTSRRHCSCRGSLAIGPRPGLRAIQEVTRTHTHTLNITRTAHLCACGSIRYVDRCPCCHLNRARHTFEPLPGSRCTGCCRRLCEAGKLACIGQLAGHLLLQPSSDMLAWPSLLQHLGGKGWHYSSGTQQGVRFLCLTLLCACDGGAILTLYKQSFNHQVSTH